MLDVIGAFVGDFIDKVTGMAEAKRRRKKTCEIMIGVFGITKCQTVSEIDFKAGYYTGLSEQAAIVGAISYEQYGEISRVLKYISKGERERLEAE